MMLLRLFAGFGILVGSIAAPTGTAAEEPLFSGPQVGEKTVPFEIRGLFENAGQTLDPVARAKGKPTVLVFVHEVTRPSIGLARAILTYAHSRANDGLHCCMVLLTSDATETENWAKRAQHAFPAKVPVGVSLHGIEGPGAYGLNRNVTLTVIVAKQDQITANFALVQPSIQVDAPRIAKAIVETMGSGKVPTLAEMGVRDYRPAAAGGGNTDALRPLLAPVIAKSASEDEVKAAATKVEQFAQENPAGRKQIGDIARRIIAAGRLEMYGTPAAQAFLKKWAKEFK